MDEIQGTGQRRQEGHLGSCKGLWQLSLGARPTFWIQSEKIQAKGGNIWQNVATRAHLKQHVAKYRGGTPPSPPSDIHRNQIQTKTLDFRGFDPSRFLLLRGGIPRPRKFQTQRILLCGFSACGLTGVSRRPGAVNSRMLTKCTSKSWTCTVSLRKDRQTWLLRSDAQALVSQGGLTIVSTTYSSEIHLKQSR